MQQATVLMNVRQAGRHAIMIEIIARCETKIVNNAQATADEFAACGLFILDRNICFIVEQVRNTI